MSQATQSPPRRASSESNASSSTANNDSARRRLREFYKLQEQQQALQEKRGQGALDELDDDEFDDDDGDQRESGEDTEMQALLDSGAVSTDEYIKRLLSEKDSQQLLQQENKLIRQLGGLESKQKALVYNNYNKLIAASETLNGIHTQDVFDSQSDVDALKRSLGSIAAISKDAHKPTTATGQQPRDAQQIQDQIRTKQAARWIMSVERQMKSLKDHGKRTEAIQRGERAVDLIDVWIEACDKDDPVVADLSRTRERCQGMLSIL